MKLSQLPIVRAIAAQTILRYDNYKNQSNNDISIETYQKYKEAHDSSLLHAAFATMGSYSVAGFTSLIAYQDLSLEALMAITAPSAIMAASIGAVGITGYLNSKLKDSDYLIAQKQIQEQMSDEFGIRLNLGDFNDEPVSDNLFKGMVSSKILSVYPRLGMEKFLKSINKIVGMGFKANIGYMGNMLGKEFCNLFQKCGNKVGLAMSKMKDKKEFFKDKISNYNKDYHNSINSLMQVMFSHVDDDVDAFLDDQYQNEYAKSSYNKAVFKKQKLYELNRDSLKLGYETILIQNTQLAFVNCLKDYCKAVVLSSTKDGVLIDENEDLIKLRENLFKFKNLYDITKSNEEEIPEYKIFSDLLGERDLLDYDIDTIKEIATEKFGETTNRINENLSSGRLIQILTLKSAILFHRKKIVKSEPNDFRINYQDAKQRLAEVQNGDLIDKIRVKSTSIVSMDDKDIVRKSYNKVKI
jgi:hypothetical protein